MRTSILDRARVFGFALIGLGTLAIARDARATTVLEVPDNGSEQMGRGGAWVARASDPLATFYNPAGLAGQDTKLTLQANVNIQSTCFTRLKAANDTTQDGTAPGQKYPEACNDTQPFPNPQIAFTYKANERLGIGFAVLGPSAAGNQSWPETVNGKAAPQRYLLLNANTLLLTPTIGVGWEPLDGWRIGASFMWGIANLDFTNDSVSVNGDNETPNTEVKAELKAKQLFIPGFTVGTIWSPSDNVDIAGWYKWMSQIDAKGDVVTTTGTRHLQTDTSKSDCGNGPGSAGLCGPDKATLKVPIPMEAKIGVRYHQPRPGIEQAHRRDPLSQDVWDLEADFTWANNSAFDAIHIGLPGDANGDGIIPVNGAAAGTLPPNADVPHNFKDVVGVRLGSDYNIIADRLAVRAGAYYETAAQDAQYQNVDFPGGAKIGVALGGTYRIHFSHVSTRALDIMLGFGHTFIASMTNNGPNGVAALAGTACYSPSNGAGPTELPGNNCSDGSQKYRTVWPVNLGQVTNAFTAINVGVSYRF